jgi:hypothetical protein
MRVCRVPPNSKQAWVLARSKAAGSGQPKGRAMSSANLRAPSRRGLHPRSAAAIEAEIAHLRSLALDALRRHCRVTFGRTPPVDLSKDLLGRMIAYRLQERAFGVVTLQKGG